MLSLGRDKLFSMTITWAIWEAQSLKVFDIQYCISAISMKDIWTHLTHALKYQYDTMVEDSDAMILERLAFILEWKMFPFYKLVYGNICSKYRTSICLFPPLIA